jgi:hypothetical protein
MVFNKTICFVNPQPKTVKSMLNIVNFDWEMIIKKKNCYRWG